MADFTINVFLTSSNEFVLAEDPSLLDFGITVPVALDEITSITITDDDGRLDPDNLSGTNVILNSNGDDQGEITGIRFRTLFVTEADGTEREARFALISRNDTATEFMIPVDATGRLLEPDPLDLRNDWLVRFPVSDARTPVDIAPDVAPVNTPPVAADDVVSVGEGETTIVNVLDGAADGVGADADADGDVLTVVSTSNGALGAPVDIPGVGSVQVQSDGTLTFQAAPGTQALGAGEEATATITYTVADPSGEEDQASVTLTVQGANDAPVANDDTATVDEDSSGNVIEVLANDTDVDINDAIFVVSVDTAGTAGQVTDNGDGTLSYAPRADFSGTDTFSYTIEDSQGATSTATVNINVLAENDAPTANPDNLGALAFNGTLDIPAATLLGNDDDGDPEQVQTLTISSVSGAVGGTAVLTAAGVSFTATPGFSGAASFLYTITDSEGAESTPALVSINVVANGTPTANDFAISVNEDGTTGVSFFENASDPDGDDLTVSLGTPANGTVEFDGEEFRYTPDPDFAGEDSFTYTVDDGNGGTDTGTVTVTVAPVNDAPVAQAQTVTGDEDTVISGQLVATDVDNDDATLTYSLVGDAANGSVTVNPDGSFEYQPDPDYNGSDGFTYRASDPDGAVSGLQTVILRVNDVAEPNRAPIAVDDTIITTESVAANSNLILGVTGDTDPEGDILQVQSASINGTPLNINDVTNVPGVGAFTLGSGGALTFTPDEALRVLDDGQSQSFNGTYTIADPDGATDEANLTIVVNGANDAPVAEADSAVTAFNTPTSIDVLANDTDPDGGDVLSLAGVSDPSNGTAEIVDGEVLYTPDDGFSGSDSFTYRVTDGTEESEQTVTISVEAPDNTAPVAQAGSITLDEDTENRGQLLYSDGETGNDALAVEIVDGVDNGTLVLGVQGAFTYTPDADFNGSDSFTYRVSDGELSSTVQTISITVIPVNDLPTVSTQFFGASENNFEFSFDLLGGAEDIDGDDLNLEDVVVSAADGRALQGVSVDAQTGILSFDAGQFEDLAVDEALQLAVTFDVNDGTGITEGSATINIQGENDDPVGVEDFASVQQGQTTTIDLVANDTDVDGDTLSIGIVAVPTLGEGTIDIVDGLLQFTAAPDFVGEVTLGYQVLDGNGGSGASQVTFTVTDTPNADPVAADFAVDTDEDVAVVIDFDPNVSDADGDTLIVTPNSASVAFSDGAFVYTPATDVFGTDSFTYTVTDGNGGVAAGEVTVNIAAVNDDPTASAASVIVTEDGSVAVDLDGLVGDVDGDDLTITLGEASNGSIVFDGEEYRYNPNPDFNGSDSFEYSVSDGNGGTATATVDIDVAPVNDAPVASDDAFTIGEAGSVVGNLISGAGGATPDSDVEGDVLNVLELFDSNGAALQLTNGNILPEGGQLAVGTDGAIFYDPLGAFDGLNAGESTTISFTYVISDGDLTDTGDVAITINGSDAPNADPVAADFTVDTDEDVAAIIDFAANTSDADGDSLTVTPGAATNGTVSFFDGAFVYTPFADANGTDFFTYTVEDGNGGSDTGTVSVNIASVNDDPTAVDGAVTGVEDSTITVDLASLVGDVDGDDLTFTVGAAANGAIRFEGGSYLYTPDADFNGLDGFSYTVEDGNGGTASADISVTVTAVNDAPVAADDVETTDANTAVTVQVLDNDTDVDGGDLLVTSIAPLAVGQGIATINADGSITYDPNGAFDLLPVGEETTVRFDYTISDGELTDTASVSIEIAGTFVDEPGPIFVEGTGRSEFVVGTSADEIIKGNGGSDRLYGEGGADVFDFTDLADDPVRTRDAIFDFDSDDAILMANDDYSVLLGSRQAIIRTDDGDTIRVAGAFTSVEELNISSMADDFIF